MCGIAGYFGQSPVAEERIAATLRRMHSRGPDHADWTRIPLAPDATQPAGVLLHTRLSVIDLDPRANQPMRLGPCTVVCNAEFYNYRELRGELAGFGVQFRTHSDTEVLLAAYLQWGPECATRLDGMWALALYDERDGTLWLSRDRFGEKPLYLLNGPDGTYFGSQADYVFTLAGKQPDVNVRHVARFLVNGYKALYKTTDQFFHDLSDLPPGTSRFLRIGEAPVSQRYWHLPLEALSAAPAPAARRSATRSSGGTATLARPAAALPKAAIEELRHVLIETVALRLRSDVPVAFCLSGGVDSGGLASIAAKRLGSPVSTFSIVDSDPRYNESLNIRRTVRDLGCRHEIVEVRRGGAVEHLRRLVGHRWAPVYTLSYFLHSQLMERIAERGFRVAVSGVGADELFSGYYDHFNLHLAEVRHLPPYDEHLRAWETHIRPLVRNPHLQRPALYVDDRGFRDHIYLNRDMFAKALKIDFDEGFSEVRYCEGLLRNRMLNELLHETVPPILRDDDLNSMRVSVENRSPYLAPGLLEAALRLPTASLIHDGFGKYPLRRALAGILNDPVRLDRHKVGFNAGFLSAFDPTNPQTRAALLDDGPIFSIVDRPSIERMLAASTMPNSFSKFLFSFLSARIFLDQFGR